MKRAPSAGPLARRRVDRLRALRGDPALLHAFAMEVLADEANPDIVRLALDALGEHVSAADGEVLRGVYAYFDAGRGKKDPGGSARTAVLQALWHLRSSADIDLAIKARSTFEPGMQSDGEMIRAAGLALLAVLDPPRAATEAVIVLGSERANPMNGEPAATAARVLAATGESNALLLYVLSGAAPTAEVTAAALKGLSGLDPEVLQRVLDGLSRSEDEAVLMAVCDAVLELPPGDGPGAILRRLLDTAPRGDLYAFIASAIVASRKEAFIDVVVESLPGETSRKRLAAAREALELAPPASAVEAALKDLDARLKTG